MKIFILGAGGMLGHKMYQTLSEGEDQVYALFRKDKKNYTKYNLYNPDFMIDAIDVRNEDCLLSTLNQHKPNVIVNCIGKTTRKIDHEEKHSVIFLNSYLPHLISNWCSKNKSYFVNFSTDCVFSGNNGPYKNNDFTDARDLYGLSKILGETQSHNGLTIRTSIVGRELENKTEFLEWIFSQRNKTSIGFKNVFYSGVTTLYLSKLVKKLISQKVTGRLQFGSEPISKYDLIRKINTLFHLNINLKADFAKVSNKTLKSVDFQIRTQIPSPKWDEMLNDFKNDNAFYENLNHTGVKAS